MPSLCRVNRMREDRNSKSTHELYTERLRDARNLVSQIEATRDALAQRLRDEQRDDAMLQATGRSSLDDALVAAQRIVARLEALAGADARTETQTIDSRARA